jgi:hypothetical protein
MVLTSDGKSSNGWHFWSDWTAYVAPWGCGQPGGLSFGPFDDAEQAIAAADRDVRPRWTCPGTRDAAQIATEEVWAPR